MPPRLRQDLARRAKGRNVPIHVADKRKRVIQMLQMSDKEVVLHQVEIMDLNKKQGIKGQQSLRLWNHQESPLLRWKHLLVNNKTK